MEGVDNWGNNDNGLVTAEHVNVFELNISKLYKKK